MKPTQYLHTYKPTQRRPNVLFAVFGGFNTQHVRTCAKLLQKRSLDGVQTRRRHAKQVEKHT